MPQKVLFSSGEKQQILPWKLRRCLLGNPRRFTSSSIHFSQLPLSTLQTYSDFFPKIPIDWFIEWSFDKVLPQMIRPTEDNRGSMLGVPVVPTLKGYIVVLIFISGLPWIFNPESLWKSLRSRLHSSTCLMLIWSGIMPILMTYLQ